jgi:hypothetical protein
LHQAGEECAGGNRLAKRSGEVNRTGGEQNLEKRITQRRRGAEEEQRRGNGENRKEKLENGK